MGAYLSKPKIEKESDFGSNDWISYGSSSMQGWRRNQEDAHNCLPNFDPKRSAAFFAVYDGHGGSEVAQYCSTNLPAFLLNHNQYAAEDVAIPINPTDIFKNTFIEFDNTLTSNEVKTKLKKIVNPDSPESSDNEDDEDDGIVPETVEDVSALHEEATKPLESVLLNKYGDNSKIPDFIQDLLSNLGSKIKNLSESTDSDEEAKEAGPGPSSSSELTTTIKVKKTSDQETTSTFVTVEEKDVKVTKPDPSQSPNVTEAAKENDDNEEEEDVPIIVANVGDDDDEDDKDFEVGDELSDEFDENEEDEDSDDTEDGSDDDDEDEFFNGQQCEEDGGDYIAPRPLAYNEPGVDSGTTACVAILLPEEDGEGGKKVCLYVANAGDSRAVLCRAGAAVDLSVDHKPEDPEEKTRIVAAGGCVTSEGRVNDGLNLSRALGDHVYKWRKDLKMSEQMISALPDVTRTELIPGADEFVVIACDGIWNSMTSQEVVDFVFDRLHPEQDLNKVKNEEEVEEKTDVEIKDIKSPAFLAKICEALFDNCIAPNTMGDGTGCDNMTCVILRLDNLVGMADTAVTRITAETTLYPSMISPVPASNERKRSESCAGAQLHNQSNIADELANVVGANGDFIESSETAVVNGNGSESPCQKKPRTEAAQPSPTSHHLQQEHPINGSA